MYVYKSYKYTKNAPVREYDNATQRQRGKVTTTISGSKTSRQRDRRVATGSASARKRSACACLKLFETRERTGVEPSAIMGPRARGSASEQIKSQQQQKCNNVRLAVGASRSMAAITRVSGTQYGSARSLVPLYDQALASERKPRRVNNQTAQVLRQYEQRAERQYGTM